MTAIDLEELAARLAATEGRPAARVDPTVDAATPARPAREGEPARAEPLDPEAREAFAFVLRSTQVRPQTEVEVLGRLRTRGYGDETIDAALARARAVGAVDDAAFARAWVADRGTQRGFGIARVREELRRRLVPEDVIDAAVAPLEARDDEAAATDLAKERFRKLPASLAPEATIRRLTAFLVRRGYPPGLAQRVAITVSGLDRDWD